MIYDGETSEYFAIKLQEDTRMSGTELASMIKITQVIDDNKKTKLGQEMNYDATPRVHDYGQLCLADFEKLGDQKLVSYYIMPHY